MRLNETDFQGGTPVDGYGPGFFRLGGTVYEGPILTGPTGTSLWGGYDEPERLTALADKIDVALVGTGAEIAHLPPAFRTTLEAAGIGVEIMSSPAAARTYNVLLGEGRRVALAMLPV